MPFFAGERLRKDVRVFEVDFEEVLTAKAPWFSSSSWGPIAGWFVLAGKFPKFG